MVSFWIRFIKLSISVTHLYQEYVRVLVLRGGGAKSYTTARHQGAEEFPNLPFPGS